jgi:mRNA interferase ChpB
MIGFRVPDRGDVYWVDPNPVSGSEMKDRHPYLVMSPKEINRFGISIAVAITQGGSGAREVGFTVPLSGSRIGGVVVCTQLRSFDMRARGAEFAETLDEGTVQLVADTIASLVGA